MFEQLNLFIAKNFFITLKLYCKYFSVHIFLIISIKIKVTPSN